MGNAWIFRKQMERAKELKGKQDAWCLKAETLKEKGDVAAISNFLESSSQDESATEYLEYDSSIAMLRGKIGINIHCYEPEDFEDMISHSKEFGFRIQAFHHALSAWQVPEMIKASGEYVSYDSGIATKMLTRPIVTSLLLHSLNLVSINKKRTRRTCGQARS